MTDYEHAGTPELEMHFIHVTIPILLKLAVKYEFQWIGSKCIVKKRMLINIRFFT
ncbi:hypothetical protein PMEGAS67_15100 [Priestia megaterium]|jgi:hypothetical protein|nr:hypothetical protein [Priestia megaterium]